MVSAIFEQFVEESPTSLMVQGLMTRVFAHQELDELFESCAQAQYTRALLFSQVVEVMSLVVCGIQPSVNAAYRRQAKALGVSRTSVYNKLNGIEPAVSAAMVRAISGQLSACIEQPIRLLYEGQSLNVRRVVVRLNCPTRDGDSEIALLTNLPKTAAGAAAVAQLYRQRWTIETLFQVVTENFEGEIQSLGYPPAALFSFCIALVAYNLLATVKAALRAVHGTGKVEASLSWYYLVEEVQATHRGMMIVVDPDYWQAWQACSLPQLADRLLALAERVNLKTFLNQPRAPKRKKPPLIVDRKHRHVSTQRLLDKQKASSP